MPKWVFYLQNGMLNIWFETKKKVANGMIFPINNAYDNKSKGMLDPEQMKWHNNQNWLRIILKTWTKRRLKNLK